MFFVPVLCLFKMLAEGRKFCAFFGFSVVKRRKRHACLLWSDAGSAVRSFNLLSQARNAVRFLCLAVGPALLCPGFLPALPCHANVSVLPCPGFLSGPALLRVSALPCPAMPSVSAMRCLALPCSAFLPCPAQGCCADLQLCKSCCPELQLSVFFVFRLLEAESGMQFFSVVCCARESASARKHNLFCFLFFELRTRTPCAFV